MKKSFSFWSLMFLLLSLMAGCQTSAQRQSISIRENNKVASQKIRVCVHNIEINPAYQNIARHFPLNNFTNPTLPQLADNGTPSDEEIKDIIKFHNEMERCRLQAIQDYMKFLPGIVPIAVRLYHKSDLVTVDLIQRKITWGESNKRRMILKDEYMESARAFTQQVSNELIVSHNAELQQRQAALNALAQYAYQQQILLQNDRLIEAINSSNSPSMRHCTLVPDGNGNMTGS
jgi:hypothetical protein